MPLDLVITHPGAGNATVRHDAWTIAAVAVIVFALSSLLHEGAGHGGACLAVHGVAREMSSMDFDCTLPDTAVTAGRIVAAGGTIATLIGGALALVLYLRTTSATVPVWRYALWLFAAVNLMQGTGYFLFSGVGNVGDWAQVVEDLEPAWAWRAGLIVTGALTYLFVTMFMFRALEPMIGEARPRRFRLALTLAVLAYFVGGLLDIVAGMLNPGGVMLVLLSGAAASLGGTSGLAWGPQMLRGPRTPSTMAVIPVALVERSWITVLTAIPCAIAFIVIFGRGLTFHP